MDEKLKEKMEKLNELKDTAKKAIKDFDNFDFNGFSKKLLNRFDDMRKNFTKKPEEQKEEAKTEEKK